MKEFKYKKVFENKEDLTNIFIPTNKEWLSTESDNLSIMESGSKGALFNKIIDDIKEAKEMVCLQSFLIQDTKIIDALIEANKKRDVRVFITDSAEARLKDSGFEEDESFSTKDYKRMLEEKFKYNFIHRQADNLHSKFILIDPKSNPKGYVFTGNFNLKPFFENPEISVKLNKLQIKELFKVFVYHFWEHTSDEQTASNQFDKVKPTGRFKVPILKNILITSPNNELSNLQNTLIDAVNKAEKEITFSTFGFDINHKLSQCILSKLKSGVSLTVFCRPREKAIKSNIEILAQNGAKVICHPLIHAKSLLVDNKEAYIFSANFEKQGMDTGFEIGIRLNEKQLKDLKMIFKKWSNSFPYIYENQNPIYDVDNYMDINFNHKKVIPEKINSSSIQVTFVREIINHINDITRPKSFIEKRFIIKSSINLKVITNYKFVENITSGIDLIQFEKQKKKGQSKIEQAILFDTDTENIDNIIASLLNNNYSFFKIFAK